MTRDDAPSVDAVQTDGRRGVLAPAYDRAALGDRRDPAAIAGQHIPRLQRQGAAGEHAALGEIAKHCLDPAVVASDSAASRNMPADLFAEHLAKRRVVRAAVETVLRGVQTAQQCKGIISLHGFSLRGYV